LNTARAGVGSLDDDVETLEYVSEQTRDDWFVINDEYARLHG
jgi:hypothetical protein